MKSWKDLINHINKCAGCSIEIDEALKGFEKGDDVFLHLYKDHVFLSVVDKNGTPIVDNFSFKKMRDREKEKIKKLYNNCWKGGKIKSFDINKFKKELFKEDG